MSIETMARAMFERFHALADRRRNWDNHPDGDAGAEPGRDTFRAMADAVMNIPEPANDPAEVPPEAA